MYLEMEVNAGQATSRPAPRQLSQIKVDTEGEKSKTHGRASKCTIEDKRPRGKPKFI